MKTTEELYQELANAVVVQAADDYRDEYMKLKDLEKNEPPYDSKTETFKAPTKKRKGSLTIVTPAKEEIKTIIPAGAEPKYKQLDRNWYKIYPSNVRDVGIPIDPPVYVPNTFVPAKEKTDGSYKVVFAEKNKKKSVNMEINIPKGESGKFTFLKKTFTAPNGRKKGYIHVIMPGGKIVRYVISAKTEHTVKKCKNGSYATVYTTEFKRKFSIPIADKEENTIKEDDKEISRYDIWKEKVQDCQRELKSIKKFFHSKWYTYLTNIDGEWLFKQINREVENYDG